MRIPLYARALGLAVALCVTSPLSVEAQEQERVPIFILSFMNTGELENPAELELAILELKQRPDIERIIIFSYGWGTDGEASYSEYHKLVTTMLANLPEERRRARVAVLAVGWDSSQSGFRRLFNNLIPLPAVADALAYLPDRILFPISFWSKAAQADRIGFGGLRTALNHVFSIYEGAERHPEIYLIGHSFGTRIISGLMLDQFGPIRVGTEHFEASSHVRGAVLFQGALVGGNLDHSASYPIVATMSRHDKAVGFLYPIANIPLNSYGFTLFEAFIQRRLFQPVARTATAAGALVTSPLQTSRETPDPDAPEEVVEEPGMLRRTAGRGWRTLGEVAALPLQLVFTVVMTPLDYVYIQTRGLVKRPVGHVRDTLAQIPIVEIPIEGIDHLLGREVIAGQRSKGLFTLGPLHEGIGRMVAPALFREMRIDPARTEREIQAPGELANGVNVVDASAFVSTGIFGLDYSHPAADFTIGWLDPIGGHTDWTDEDAMRLAAWLLNHPLVREQNQPPTPEP